jgi:cupin 2 domain-containing protein
MKKIVASSGKAERLKCLERTLREQISEFRASDRVPRDDLSVRPTTSRRVGNLLDGISLHGRQESSLELLSTPGVRVERIVSTGQASPPGFWYDQAWAEWVLVVSGEALLQFEDESEPRRLTAGDYLHIAPHRRHRVAWTDPNQPTIWLAIHVGREPIPV